MRHPLAQATLDKVGIDEPIFVLRAQDMFAGDTVDDWADRAESALGSQHPKVMAARLIAYEMRAYHIQKIPD